jgi:hypothetical protein
MKINAVIFMMFSGIALYGQTAEAPKRTVFDSKGQELKRAAAPAADTYKPAGAAGVPENGRGASYRALDTLSSSTEDMNAIRDSNVRRLTKDGCAPEVSARIGDLRSRLQAAGVAPDATEKSSRAVREDSGSDSSTLALASNWFKATGNGKATAAPVKDKSIDLLDSVLPIAAGKDAIEAKDPRPSQDIASLKAELEHLYAACPGAKR